jgi:hypothetical protein
MLLKDVAQCGLYRQPHHEKVTPEELSKEVKALIDEVSALKENEEDAADSWRANARLAEISDALDLRSMVTEDEARVAAAKDALLSFRDLLKKTEKGNLTDELCTAYELELSGMPGHLLRFLKHGAPTNVADPIRQPSLNQERWNYFREVFSEQTKQTRKGLGRLVKALHAVIETGEVFPVWRHKRERGLRALTEAVQLKLRHVGGSAEGCTSLAPYLPQAMKPQVSVMVEPLVPMSELSRYLIRVTPTTDKQYLAYCRNLVGATICDQVSGTSYSVQNFEILLSDLPLPIHTVQQEGAEEPQRLLLAAQNYVIKRPSDQVCGPLSDFRITLDLLDVVTGAEALPAVLDDLPRILRGEVAPADSEAATAAEKNQDAVVKVLQELVQSSNGRTEEVLAIVTEERARVTAASGVPAEGAPAGTEEGGVDPTMRVHTVMIAVSDEIPFELFWPMVRDDIMVAVRELFPRGSPNMAEAVQAGVAQNGMGPIAQRLTLEEAEALAARVGHVVQTAVTVDANAVQEVQRERTKTEKSETIPVSSRIQFSAKSGDTWVPGVVVGHGPLALKSGSNEKFDVIDDSGVLWERLPRNRVRIPPGRRETPSSAGTPIQAVLSQADLVRIREHLRRRQEEWAERHATLGTGGSGAAGPGPRADSAAAGVDARSDGRPAASRPTSAPAIAQLPRATSAGAESPGTTARRGASGGDLSSREESLGEVDPNSALDMVHFLEEDGIADEEFDDDGDGPPVPGEDGDEDDEDLPPLEPSEAGDSAAEAINGPRLGSSRSREGEGEGGGSMEEELRVLEQLRAMEQIISEVLDPQEAGSRRREGSGATGEDFMPSHAPMANLRIRMGGAGEGRVETYTIRRASGSRGSERASSHGIDPIRGDLPAFVRAADSSNPTSSLDHPVVERFGAADLVEDETPDEPMEQAVPESIKPLQLCVRYCLHPPPEPETSPGKLPSAAAAAPAPPRAASSASAPRLTPKDDRSWMNRRK